MQKNSALALPVNARLLLLLAISLLIGCQDDPSDATTNTRLYPPAKSLQAGQLEIVHAFNGPMPTGVTVSHDGRIFVTFPRWEDNPSATLVEIRDRREIPFPDAELNKGDSVNSFLSVQSAVVDPKNRLWALDTGSINMEPIRGFEWPKLVCIDLASNHVIKTIRFPEGVIHHKSYLNDIRFDLKRGAEGMAFITDSSAEGPNGIIIVDLASGRSWRRLHEHPSVMADPTFSALMEGEPLMQRKPNSSPKPLTVGSDGIAISADGERLFYCALSSRQLHSVSIDALVDRKISDREVADSVTTEPRRFASDGLESDSKNRIYLTDWEHNAIHVRTGENSFETLVSDPQMWWPDTLSLSTDGYLYIISNQLHRQAKFHDGVDRRVRPFYLYRMKINAKPVLLR
jgi:sugar lactone lactonase YvrE